MGPLGMVLLFIGFTSFMTFVTFFGRLPALRRTPIAGLHRLLWVHIPKLVTNVDQKLTSGLITDSLSRFTRYLLYDRHPTVVIFFIVVMMAAQLLFLPNAWPKIGFLAKFSAAVAVTLPYVFLYLACAADPGYVTPDTLAHHMSRYPYDFALFHPGRVCRTCKLPKPPRSKHCSICKRCVARSDHHCIFINSCVGYRNHHWFLLLLISTAAMTSYGGLLGLGLITEPIRQRHPTWSLWPWAASNASMQSWLAIFGRAIHTNLGLGASTLLALLISPLIWGLLAYSLYLVYCGTTTNESLKWVEWREDMREGYAFERRLPHDRPRDWRYEASWTRWPAEPDRILITTSDGQPPGPDAAIPGEGPWERVWGLKNVSNIYDLGLWDNMRDIFFIDYPFRSRDENLGHQH